MKIRQFSGTSAYYIGQCPGAHLTILKCRSEYKQGEILLYAFPIFYNVSCVYEDCIEWCLSKDELLGLMPSGDITIRFRELGGPNGENLQST